MLKLPFLLATTLLTACGSDRPQLFGDHRSSSHHEAPTDSPAPVQTPGTSAPKPAPEPGEVTDSEVDRQIYDQYANRSVDAAYFQAAPSLAGLFGAGGDSQLCWPAALAYAMEYQRSFRRPALSSLPLPSPGARTDRLTGDVRYFAGACHTDLQTGTTVPQGVSCITARYKTSGYKPQITVTGLDSKWGASGYYPADTALRSRPLTPSDIRSDLSDDLSVILLVGFYELDPAAQTWRRTRGHFISVTGYGYKTQWADSEMTVDVVNPGVDYSSRPVDQRYDRLKMLQLDPASLPAPLPSNVTNTDYRLGGPGFNVDSSTELALVESAVSFDAAPLTSSSP